MVETSNLYLRCLLAALVGFCLGITMSMMYAPYQEHSCESFVARQDPQHLLHIRNTKSLSSSLSEEVEKNSEPRIHRPAVGPSLGSLDSTSGKVKRIIRPRYVSTELGIREKLFLGVVTSREAIGSLGVALNKTASGYVSKLMFFMSSKGSSIPAGMTIVNFANNLSHLTPIHMLRYVAEHFTDAFDYYMFATDHTYLRAEHTFDMVSHISVSQHVYMGHIKSTESGGRYCSMDGGIVISQGPMKVYKVDHFTPYAIAKLSILSNFNISHTVFPVPDASTFYRLHRYFCLVDINSTQQEIAHIEGDIMKMTEFAPGGEASISWPIGVPEPYKPKNRFDVIRWDYFTETDIYFHDDFTNVKPIDGIDRLDIQEVIRASVQHLNSLYSGVYLYSALHNGYRRFDPQRGMEYIVDMVLQDMSNKDNLVYKRIQLVRPLGQANIIPVPYVTETSRIHAIVPVMEADMDGLTNFLEKYSKTCMVNKENTELLVIFIYAQIPSRPEQEDVFSVLKSVVTYYNQNYASSPKINWLPLQSNGTYVSEFDLVDSIVANFMPDSIIFLGSIGMDVSAELLSHVRMNTIAGHQVFFPIGFWQYKPNLIYDTRPFPTDIDFVNKVGHYDTLSFEHASFHRSDYDAARRSAAVSDILTNGDIFQMFVRYGGLHVFRPVEPSLKHGYSNFTCPMTLPSNLRHRCLDRRSKSLATRSQLAKLILERRGTVRSDDL